MTAAKRYAVTVWDDAEIRRDIPIEVVAMDEQDAVEECAEALGYHCSVEMLADGQDVRIDVEVLP